MEKFRKAATFRQMIFDKNLIILKSAEVGSVGPYPLLTSGAPLFIVQEEGKRTDTSMQTPVDSGSQQLFLLFPKGLVEMKKGIGPRLTLLLYMLTHWLIPLLIIMT